MNLLKGHLSPAYQPYNFRACNLGTSSSSSLTVGLAPKNKEPPQVKPTLIVFYYKFSLRSQGSIYYCNVVIFTFLCYLIYTFGRLNVNVLNSSHSKLQFLSQIVTESTHIYGAPSNLLNCVTIPPLANSDHLGLYFCWTKEICT